MNNEPESPIPLLCLIAAPLIAAVDVIPFWARGMLVIVAMLLPIYFDDDDE